MSIYASSSLKKKSKFLPFKREKKEKSELQHSLYVRLL